LILRNENAEDRRGKDERSLGGRQGGGKADDLIEKMQMQARERRELQTRDRREMQTRGDRLKMAEQRRESRRKRVEKAEERRGEGREKGTYVRGRDGRCDGADLRS
jgi:hypothetical protein